MLALEGLGLMAVFVGAVLVFLGLFHRLHGLVVRRTIDAWGGRGVNDRLAPHRAGMLLGLHPSFVVAILLEELRLAGRARGFAEPHEPCRLAWSGGAPRDRVEEALLAAVDAEGRFRPEGVVALVETIWAELDHEMKRDSGRATALHYRRLAAKLWKEDLDALVEVPGSFPFFLLHDPKRDWDRVGDDPVSTRFKEAFRLAERMNDRLVPDEVWSERARTAKSGFFRYRRDLVIDDSHVWRGKNPPPDSLYLDPYPPGPVRRAPRGDAETAPAENDASSGS